MNHNPVNKQVHFLQTNRKSTSITWIGHSTFLIQIGGLNILTDPVWSSFIGLNRRVMRPSLCLDQLPAIDVVLISSGKYDHLHFRTFQQLKGDPLYLVPYGLQELFMRKGFMNVKEFSWWNQFEKIPLEFTFAPAGMEGRTSLFSHHHFLMGGWICHSPKTGEHIYFAGDTGYYPGIGEIGSKFPIDLALIPIGPYKLEWFHRNLHITPKDAVRAFIELQAEMLIPTQFGTFQVPDPAGYEELNRLKVEWSQFGLSDHKLSVLHVGETCQMGINEDVQALCGELQGTYDLRKLNYLF